MEHRGFRGTLVAAAVGAAFAGEAGAAAFALIEQNASGLGNAYSGAAAAAEDASTIWFNPAGMTRLRGRQAVGSLELVKPSAKFSNNGSVSSTPPAAVGPAPGFAPLATGIPLGGTGGDAGDWAALPNAYLSWEAMPNQLWFGVGIGAPFGLTTEWDSNWMGRFHAIKSELMTININPSAAWKINEMVSLGVGFNMMYIDAKLTNQVAYGATAASVAATSVPAGLSGAAQGAVIAATGTGPNGTTGLAREDSAQVKAHDWGFGFNLGAMINFSPATRLGLHYRSEVQFHLEGDASFNNAPVYNLAGPLAALGAGLNAAFANGGVTADITMPASFSVALAHQFDPRWQVLADYTWTGWNSIQDLSIYRTNGAALTSTPLKFKNSWRAGIGVNYQLTDQWKLRGGVAYDTTPVQDEFRTPRLPDQDRTWLSIGGQWQFSKEGALDFGYAYLFIKDGSSNLPNLDPAPPAGFRASPKGALVGNYSSNVNILGVQVRYNF